MPPPDVIAKGGKGNVDLTVARLGKLLEGSGGASLDVERIRQELPSEVAQFEVIEFRICAQYGNGVLSKQAYQAFTEKIIPAYTKNPPEKVLLTASDPELVQVVEACGPSFTTKRVTAKFVPDWIFHLNSLRRERNTYDLQNLFEVAGRIPVGLTGKDLIQEATFTLNCLSDRRELRMERLGASGRYWGEDFENRRITFLKP